MKNAKPNQRNKTDTTIKTRQISKDEDAIETKPKTQSTKCTNFKHENSIDDLRHTCMTKDNKSVKVYFLYKNMANLQVKNVFFLKRLTNDI